MTTTTLQIQGMRCAGCVASVEKGLRAQAGVSHASVNLLTNTAKVDFDEAQAKVSDLIKAVESTGYHATTEPAKTADVPASSKSESNDTSTSHATHSTPLHWFHEQLTRWLPLLAIPVVIMGMAWHTNRSAWIQFALAFPIQLVLGWPFYRGAVHALRYRRADMDLLVALGTSVAFAYSFYHMYRGGHEVYFHN